MDKVQTMIGEIRQEVLNNITTSKKESGLKQKQKDQDYKQLRLEFE